MGIFYEFECMCGHFFSLFAFIGVFRSVLAVIKTETAPQLLNFTVQSQYYFLYCFLANEEQLAVFGQCPQFIVDNKFEAIDMCSD